MTIKQNHPMKKLKIIIAIFGIAIFSLQQVKAQTDNKVEQKVYKTTRNEMPQKVKDALQDYSGYQISEKASFTKKSNGDVYKIKITKGKWTNYLLINEKGKVLGVETGEYSGG